MSTIKPSYGAFTSITITFTSLASAAARQSAVVDNTTNLYDDALVSITYKTASGALGTNPVVNIYVYVLGDGTNYSDGASGSDASYTMPTGSVPKLIAVHAPTASATQYTIPLASIANAFGGTLPSKWGIIIQNSTGLAMDASVGTASFLPVQYTNA